MILAAFAATAALASSPPPDIQKDLRAPAGPQPKPHLLKDLKARAYQAPSVLPVQLEGSGLLKDLRLSPQMLPSPTDHGLDKDLRVGPAGDAHALGVLPIQTQRGAPPKVRVVPGGAVKDWTLPPQAERTPNLFNPPERCRDAAVKAVDKDGRPRPRKLTDLPPGALQLAVDRRIDGCPVLTIVYGDVIPDPQGPTVMRLEPLTPRAEPPAKHEGEPSNRR